MATNLTDYEQTTVTAPEAPSTTSTFDIKIMRPLIREIYTGIVDEIAIKMGLTSAKSFFTGNSTLNVGELLNNLTFGQEIVVPIYKDQNPLSLYTSNDVEYDDFDACHTQIKVDCSVPCLNTLPDFDKIKIRFDKEYAYGVRACDRDRQFWDYGFFTRQYAKSRAGMDFGRELDLWNNVITAAIAAPATTVDVLTAANHPTHYWSDLGDVATNRDHILEFAQYLIGAYDVNPTIFMPKEIATALIESVENPYNLNLSQTVVRTFNKWDVPGYEISEAVSNILGAGSIPVVIMVRSPWMSYKDASGSIKNIYPLMNEDMTKAYVVVADPRVGYNLELDGYHLDIEPYDCDKLIRGMVDTIYVAMGITFPQYIGVLEYNVPGHGGSEPTPDVPATGITLSATSAEIAAGAETTITATVTPATTTDTVVFTTSDKSVATVTYDGNTATITGVKAGSAAITATAGSVNTSAVVTVTE